MSLGGGLSTALTHVVDECVKQVSIVLITASDMILTFPHMQGVHFTVAAGGQNSDSCNRSPANSELA